MRKRPLLTEEAVLMRIRRQCEILGSQRQWALAHGISPQFLGDVLKGDRAVSKKIFTAMGLVRIAYFVEKA